MVERAQSYPVTVELVIQRALLDDEYFGNRAADQDQLEQQALGSAILIAEAIRTSSDGGVEVRHAETGNMPGSVPGEEMSSAATSFERATAQGAAIEPRAGVTPGPSEALNPSHVMLELRHAFDGDNVVVKNLMLRKAFGCIKGLLDPAQTLPDGFVLVPREPSNEILKAGCVALDKPLAKEKMLAAMVAPGQKGIAIARTKMRIRWEAMIEAALVLPSTDRGGK